MKRLTIMLTALVALAGCGFAGVNAHKPEDVLTASGAWVQTYPVGMNDAARLVAEAANASEWRPVALSTPEHVFVFDTGTGYSGVGIWGRVTLLPLDDGHTGIEVVAIRKNDLHITTDAPLSAMRRYHAELLRVAATEVAR
jgi:hypothetical protein